jgi:hypothetical protein
LILLLCLAFLTGCQQKEEKEVGVCFADNLYETEQEFLDKRAENIREGVLEQTTILRPIPQSDEFSLYHVAEPYSLNGSYRYEYLIGGEAVQIHIDCNKDSFNSYLKNFKHYIGEYETYVWKGDALYSEEDNAWVINYDGHKVSFDLPESIVVGNAKELEAYFTIEAYSITQ